MGFVIEYEVNWVRSTYGPFLGPNGNHYEFVLGGRTWTWEDARDAARCRTFAGRIGHLATIGSLTEDEFIDSLRPTALQGIGYNITNSASHPPLWIGGIQAAGQASAAEGWSWSNGEGAIPGVNGGGAYANWLMG